MRTGFKTENELDGDGNPAGGCVQGIGIEIDWQDGPLGPVGTEEPVGPNGALVEDVIDAARQRIQFYQEASGGRFKCRENAIALTKLDEALLWLDSRTARRMKQGVEGTHEGS